jgi:hypothetical protein
VTQRLGQPADVGADDGEPAAQGLGHDHAVGLGAGGQHEDVSARVGPVEVDVGERARESHPVVDASRRGGPAEVIHEGGVRAPGAHAHAAPWQVLDDGQRRQQHVVPLGPGVRPDAQQLSPAPGAHDRLGQVDAGLRDVHAPR